MACVGHRLAGNDGVFNEVMTAEAFASRHVQIDAQRRALTAMLIGYTGAMAAFG
jgi:hypothetical protein